MRLRILLLTAGLVLTVSVCAQATDKTNVVAFYQAYLELVSASDFVTSSRDDPDGFGERFDAVAKQAGFEDAAAALAAGDALKTDSDVASLRQAVADKIVQQYQPYRE